MIARLMLRLLILSGTILCLGTRLLAGPAIVSGTVYSDPTRPAPWIELVIVNLETKELTVVTTNEAGQFNTQVPGGDYAVYYAEPGTENLLATLRLDDEDSQEVEIQLITIKGEEVVPEDRAREEESSSARQTRHDQESPRDKTLESIRNFRVQTNGFGSDSPSREFSEIVNPFPAQSKTGWHGSLYLFHRNDNFDARNFFDPVGEPLPEYKRNQFGFIFGTTLAGGLNLLGSYEGLRIIQGSTLLSHVPTAAMKEGDFSALDQQLRDPFTGDPLPNNRIPPERIHPVAHNLLSLLPDPNRGDPDRNFVNNQPFVRDSNTFSIRADRQLDDFSKIYARYSFDDTNRIRVHPLPEFGWDNQDRDQSATFSYTRNVNSRFILTGRLRFSRSQYSTLSRNAGREGLLDSLGIAGVHAADPAEEGYPEFSLAGYAPFGDRRSPVTNIYNLYSVEGSASYAVDSHLLRFGFDLNAYQVNNYRLGRWRRGRFTFNGYYSGDAFADFLLGLPDKVYRSVGSDRSDLRSKQWEFFFRDNWKVSPEFAFNYGITYNYYRPYESIHNDVSTFSPLQFEPPLDGEIVIAGSERAKKVGLDKAGENGLVFPDKNNWAPRIGLEYSPFGNRSLVFDSSYLIYHFRPSRRDFSSYLGRNFPFYYTETAESPVSTPELGLSTPFEATAPTELRIRAIEPRLQTPYMQHWRFSAQSEIVRNWVLEAAYRGNKGTHLTRELIANVPLPGPGSIQPRRPNPNFAAFDILTGSGSYTRHSLNLELDRRLSEGLAFKSGFTWNRAFSDAYEGNPSNPRDLRAERAPSNYLPTRSFFLSYIYDLPFGREPEE